MNLLCPNCQKQLSVAEQSAGQLMKCPFCSRYFLVPALPEAATEAAGPGTPSAATPGAGPGTAPTPESSSSALRQDAVALGPTLAAAQIASPSQNKAAGERLAAPLPPYPNDQLSPPPLPTGYEQTVTLWISPRVVRWLAPAALLLVLILMFFPWTGAFPGGWAVYTQNAFQMIWGGFSVDPVGDKVLGMAKAIHGAMRANWLMLFYPLLILAALLLAAAPLVLSWLTFPPPRPLQQIWPWRSMLVVSGTLLALFILLSFLVNGSGFENAVRAAVADKSSAMEWTAATLEEQIQRGLELDRLHLRRTFWLHSAVCFHVLALVGAGLELWLERRGARPLPRIEFHW